jgi:(R,R)-butanediol dehydrogenase/meso-butanediol dehydrogenase/diacetyl reductase
LHDGPILVADRNAGRAALVAEVTGAAVAELDAGSIRSALGEKAALRYALDATGSAGVFSTLLGLLAGGGSIALVGITHGTIDLDPNMLVEREIALVGCHAFAGELADAAAMLPELSTSLLRLVDREIRLEEIPSAYARLLAGDARGLKTVIRMGEPPK